LSISVNASATLSSIPPGTTPGIAAEGGTTSLYDNIATISISVKNTGTVAAAEVAQELMFCFQKSEVLLFV
jgi:beta-glucosidase